MFLSCNKFKLCAYACKYVCFEKYISIQVRAGSKRVSDPMELESQMIVVIKHIEFSPTKANDNNHGVISPATTSKFYLLFLS